MPLHFSKSIAARLQAEDGYTLIELLTVMVLWRSCSGRSSRASPSAFTRRSSKAAGKGPTRRPGWRCNGSGWTSTARAVAGTASSRTVSGASPSRSPRRRRGRQRLVPGCDPCRLGLRGVQWCTIPSTTNPARSGSIASSASIPPTATAGPGRRSRPTSSRAAGRLARQPSGADGPVELGGQHLADGADLRQLMAAVGRGRSRRRPRSRSSPE